MLGKSSLKKSLTKQLFNVIAMSCCVISLMFPDWKTVLAETYTGDLAIRPNAISAGDGLHNACITNINGNSSNLASQRLQADCNAIVGQAFATINQTGDSSTLLGNEIATSLNAITLEELTNMSTNTFNRVSVNLKSISNRMLAMRDSNARQFAVYGDNSPRGGSAGGNDTFDRLGVFFNTRYRKFDQSINNLETGYNSDILNFIGGADYRFSDQLIFGAAFNYGNDDIDVDNKGGGIRSDKYGLSLYSTFYAAEQFFVDGIIGYEWGNNRISRNINYVLSNSQQTINQQATASPARRNSSIKKTKTDQ